MYLNPTDVWFCPIRFANKRCLKKLRNDDRLRALCLSGAISLQDYVDMLTSVGFGTVEIRAKRPYRILDPEHYDTDSLIYIESVEVCAN